MSGLGAEQAMSVLSTNLEQLSAPTAVIEPYLSACIDQLIVPKNLVEAAEYAVLGGGKRLRPLLAWWSCEAVGVDGRESLPATAAVEFIHAFSLVHDDLPALDNDDLRRGKPTLHKHAGEAMAILTGDALLNGAYRVLVQKGPQDVAPAMVELLVDATGKMIGGQVLDTLGGFDNAWTPERRVLHVHQEKTAALIVASCLMGLECAQSWWRRSGAKRGALADPWVHVKAIATFGEAVGLMFQIVDDLLDVEQKPEVVGKRTSKDAAAGKLTFPGVIGVEASRGEVARLRARAMSAIEPLGPSAQPLRDLCEYLCVRTQ